MTAKGTQDDSGVEWMKSWSPEPEAKRTTGERVKQEKCGQQEWLDADGADRAGRVCREGGP